MSTWSVRRAKFIWSDHVYWWTREGKEQETRLYIHYTEAKDKVSIRGGARESFANVDTQRKTCGRVRIRARGVEKNKTASCVDIVGLYLNLKKVKPWEQNN